MFAPFLAQLNEALHLNLKIIVRFAVGFVGGFHHFGISRRLRGFILTRLPDEFRAAFIIIIRRRPFIRRKLFKHRILLELLVHHRL